MSTSSPSRRLGDVALRMRTIDRGNGESLDTKLHKRQLIADLCRVLLTRQRVTLGRESSSAVSQSLGPDSAGSESLQLAASAASALPPRLRQTLERLLEGDAEQ